MAWLSRSPPRRHRSPGAICSAVDPALFSALVSRSSSRPELDREVAVAAPIASIKGVLPLERFWALTPTPPASISAHARSGTRRSSRAARDRRPAPAHRKVRRGPASARAPCAFPWRRSPSPRLVPARARFDERRRDHAPAFALIVKESNVDVPHAIEAARGVMGQGSWRRGGELQRQLLIQ